MKAGYEAVVLDTKIRLEAPEKYLAKKRADNTGEQDARTRRQSASEMITSQEAACETTNCITTSQSIHSKLHELV